MADGSSFTPRAADHNSAPTLGQAAGRGLRLLAVCAAPDCDRRTILDPGPWIGQGLTSSPLAALQRRVRCICGGRAARLELCAEVTAPPATCDLFMFR